VGDCSLRADACAGAYLGFGGVGKGADILNLVDKLARLRHTTLTDMFVSRWSRRLYGMRQ